MAPGHRNVMLVVESERLYHVDCFDSQATRFFPFSRMPMYATTPSEIEALSQVQEALRKYCIWNVHRISSDFASSFEPSSMCSVPSTHVSSDTEKPTDAGCDVLRII